MSQPVLSDDDGEYVPHAYQPAFQAKQLAGQDEIRRRLRPRPGCDESGVPFWLKYAYSDTDDEEYRQREQDSEEKEDRRRGQEEQEGRQHGQGEQESPPIMGMGSSVANPIEFGGMDEDLEVQNRTEHRSSPPPSPPTFV